MGLFLAGLLALADATVADVELRDARGTPVRLADPARPTVVVFLNADCPMAQLSAPRLAALAGRYAPGAVRFLAVGVGAEVPPPEFAGALPFPYLRDPDGRLAEALGATRSPEAFVLGAARRRTPAQAVARRPRRGAGRSRRRAAGHGAADGLRRLPARPATRRPRVAGSDVRPRHRADPGAALRRLPPARRGRPVRAHELRPGPRTRRDAGRVGRGRGDAAVGRGPRVRPLPQRPPAERGVEAAGRRVGAARLPRRPARRRAGAGPADRLGDRHAGRGLRDAGGVRRAGRGRRRVPALLRRSRLHSGNVGRRRRGAAGQPPRRPPLHRLAVPAGRDRPGRAVRDGPP